MIEKDEIFEDEKLFVSRRHAGLDIDPQTAEVSWRYASVYNPYREFPARRTEYWVQRTYFARSSDSDIWVWFGELLDETQSELWAKNPIIKMNSELANNMAVFRVLIDDQESVRRKVIANSNGFLSYFRKTPSKFDGSPASLEVLDEFLERAMSDGWPPNDKLELVVATISGYVANVIQSNHKGTWQVSYGEEYQFVFDGIPSIVLTANPWTWVRQRLVRGESLAGAHDLFISRARRFLNGDGKDVTKRSGDRASDLVKAIDRSIKRICKVFKLRCESDKDIMFEMFKCAIERAQAKRIEEWEEQFAHWDHGDEGDFTVDESWSQWATAFEGGLVEVGLRDRDCDDKEAIALKVSTVVEEMFGEINWHGCIKWDEALDLISTAIAAVEMDGDQLDCFGRLFSNIVMVFATRCVVSSTDRIFQDTMSALAQETAGRVPRHPNDWSFVHNSMRELVQLAVA
jgi:hypothetical protein